MTKLKILTYISDLHVENRAGGCRFCLTTSKTYSKHEITLCGKNEIESINLNEFDIIHTHEAHQKFLKPTTAKIAFGMHGFGFTCPPGGYYCLVLNNYLEQPLTCLNCLGWLGITTGFNNLKKVIKFGKKVDAITVDCKFMQEFYHAYNPTLLPLPMETDILKPSETKDNYILYMGRLSFEKNPYGFLEIAKHTKQPCKMILYEIYQDIVGLRSNYNDIFSSKLSNLEIILNPTKEKMIELIKHAKFVVLPYLFAEPFGVAAANTVMCGTPLIAFPFGNNRYITHLLPKTLHEMKELLNMNNKQYNIELNKTLEKGNILREIHNPKHAIEVWDNFYEQLYNKTITTTTFK